MNAIRPGALVMRLPDSELSDVPLWLFAGVSGSLGVLASLPRTLFQFLERLQTALRDVINGVGGFDHALWRAFSNQHTPYAPAHGFVDGDLIEQFLDLRCAGRRGGGRERNGGLNPGRENGGHMSPHSP